MNKNVNYYLAKGYELKMAEYFASGRKHIINVVPNDNFTLTLTFDNGEVRLYDVAPIIKESTVFDQLRKIENFRRVYLDENNIVSWDIDPNVDSTIVWNNKIDICPDSCYVDSVPFQGGVTNV